MAVIATSILGKYFEDKNKISTYTFGSPRVGNQQFALYFDSVFGNSYRIVNSNDLVPHVPSSL